MSGQAADQASGSQSLWRRERQWGSFKPDRGTHGSGNCVWAEIQNWPKTPGSWHWVSCLSFSVHSGFSAGLEFFVYFKLTICFPCTVATAPSASMVRKSWVNWTVLWSKTQISKKQPSTMRAYVFCKYISIFIWASTLLSGFVGLGNWNTPYVTPRLSKDLSSQSQKYGAPKTPKAISGHITW